MLSNNTYTRFAGLDKFFIYWRRSAVALNSEMKSQFWRCLLVWVLYGKFGKILLK